MTRKTLRKPSARKRIVRKPVSLWQKVIALTRRWFHPVVDVVTMAASLATVATLVLLVRDRPHQENIAAWTLLQSYLQSSKRSESNQGQSFALETLAQNGIKLELIEANGVRITSADLHGAIFNRAEFRQAAFESPNLTGADFTGAVLQGASISQCQDCRDIVFNGTDLHDARIGESNLSGDNFHLADISGLEFSDVTLERHALETACFRKDDPPRFWHIVIVSEIGDEQYVPADAELIMPMDPQGELCMQDWGNAWGDH